MHYNRIDAINSEIKILDASNEVANISAPKNLVISTLPVFKIEVLLSMMKTLDKI